MANDSTIRVCLWSGPRNISTALMYSFAQRNDTRVFDEPFYAHYLSSTDAKEYHPGAEDIMEGMENDGQKVIEAMFAEHDKPVLFFKQMSHHLVNLDLSFLSETVNIILTRDPVEMLPSYARKVPNPAMRDVGYRQHLELFNYLKKIGNPPVVLISEKVLKNPEKMLMKLCGSIGIPFDKAMLSWEKGARPEDGVWAKNWYHNVHNSTGFKKVQQKTEPFPEALKPLLEECMPVYNELIRCSI